MNKIGKYTIYGVLGLVGFFLIIIALIFMIVYLCG